jgi:arginyl-tRNA synthetase
MQGFTGPFIQYTHARIKSILRKAGDFLTHFFNNCPITTRKGIVAFMEQFGTIVKTGWHRNIIHLF